MAAWRLLRAAAESPVTSGGPSVAAQVQPSARGDPPAKFRSAPREGRRRHAATGSRAIDLICVKDATCAPNIGAFFGVQYRLSYRQDMIRVQVAGFARGVMISP